MRRNLSEARRVCLLGLLRLREGASARSGRLYASGTIQDVRISARQIREEERPQAVKSLAIMVGCALLGWLAKRREPTLAPVDEQAVREFRERQQRFLRDLYAANAPRPRVVESQHGVFIRASCEAEAAEIVSQAPQFRARVA